MITTRRTCPLHFFFTSIQAEPMIWLEGTPVMTNEDTWFIAGVTILDCRDEDETHGGKHDKEPLFRFSTSVSYYCNENLMPYIYIYIKKGEGGSYCYSHSAKTTGPLLPYTGPTSCSLDCSAPYWWYRFITGLEIGTLQNTNTWLV